MVSVVMATYNGERFIEKQLLSIYEQSRQPDEVIICDDGSTDSTHEIVRNFIKERGLDNWLFSVNPENLGYTQNFFQGGDKARGDIIFWSDQDDIWHKDKIKIMAGIMEEKPEILALVCDYISIDKDDNIIPENRNWEYPRKVLIKHSFCDISKGNWTGMIMAVRKDILRFRLNSVKGAGHDGRLACEACVMDGLYHYTDVLAYHRLHGTNATSSMPETKRSAALKMRLIHHKITKINHALNITNAMGFDDKFASEINHLHTVKRVYEKQVMNLEQRKFFSSLLMLRYVPKYLPLKTYIADIVLYQLNLVEFFKFKI